MQLNEDNVLKLFQELARWMIQRRLHADIGIDGGVALVLQTNFREAGSDLDMRFTKITTDKPMYTGSKTKSQLSAKERSELFEEFFTAHKNTYPIDAEYTRYFSNMVEGDQSYYGLRTNPYASFIDIHGHGITVHLATLEYLYDKKMLRLSIADTDQDIPSKSISGDLHDGYALSLVLNERWDRAESPITDENKIQRIRTEGLKPTIFKEFALV